MFLVSLAVLFLAVPAANSQPFTWVIQNIYRQPSSCVPEGLISINSWRTDLCLKFNSTHYNKRSCDSTQVQSNFYTDAGCSTSFTGQTAFPANQCGSTGSNQGVFFACESLNEPPTLPNQNNDVFNSLYYLKTGGMCGSAQVHQSLSYIANDVCVLTEKRNCVCSGPSNCTGFTLSPCSGPTGPEAAFRNCVDTGDYFESDRCLVAVMPTPTPSNPENPPGTSPSTLAACSDATTYDQCVAGATVPPNNFPTLPVTGLIRKCCVWCSGSSGSSCIEPGFSGTTCTCPANTTDFNDLQTIYQCPAGQQSVFGCSCTGRPFGAASCTDNAGTPPGGGGGGAASSIAVATGLMAAAVCTAALLL